MKLASLLVVSLVGLSAFADKCSIEAGWIDCGNGTPVYDEGCSVECSVKAVCNQAEAFPNFDPNRPGDNAFGSCTLFPSSCGCQSKD
jgi:hypothetical protein